MPGSQAPEKSNVGSLKYGLGNGAFQRSPRCLQSDLQTTAVHIHLNLFPVIK